VSTLGLIGLVLVALAAAMVVALVVRSRRRNAVAEVARPKTVADLVRLRTEAVAEQSPEPAASRASVQAPVGPEHVEEAVPRHPAVLPEPAALEPGPAVAAEPEPAAAPELDLTDDTPWRRAAVMAAGGTDPGAWHAQAAVEPVPGWLVPAAGEPNGWAGWADWAEVDAEDDHSYPSQAGSAEPDVVGASAAQSAPAEPAAAEPASAEPTTTAGPAAAAEHAASDPGPAERATAASSPAWSAAADPVSVDPGTNPPPPSRGRRTPEERAAEQAAADLALLRTFGFADPSLRPDAAPVVSMVRPDGAVAPPAPGGDAQPMRFWAVRRNGATVGGAAVTLLDDKGNEVGTGTAGADGRGEVLAPSPGSYVLVSTAPGHQPGAVAITVAESPTEAEVLLVRSASVSGAVHGEDGPIAGARVALVQDGEIVDAVDTDEDGEYRIEDIGAGEYGLSVAAAGCEPIASLLDVPDETDLHHDVDLEPAAPTAEYDRSDDDMMSGHR
jgi:hypothetical protein